MLNSCSFYLLLWKLWTVGAGCQHRCSMDDKWLLKSSSCTCACKCIMMILPVCFFPSWPLCMCMTVTVGSFYFSPSKYMVSSSLTDCASPWDSLSTTHSTLQEVTSEPHLNPLLSSYPASVPNSPHQLHLETTACMADKAPRLTNHSSIRGVTGGRSTHQKCITRRPGMPQGSGEVDCGNRQPRDLPSKAVLGRSIERKDRQRDTCSPCCERKGLHPQVIRSAWPWDPYASVNLNGAPLGNENGHVNLQERLTPRGLLREEERPSGHSRICCPSKTVDDPPGRSAAASPGSWNVPDKLPGTLRSWTSTVSR